MAVSDLRDSEVIQLSDLRDSRVRGQESTDIAARPGESLDDYIDRIVATAGTPSPKALAQLPYQLPPVEIPEPKAAQQAA